MRWRWRGAPSPISTAASPPQCNSRRPANRHTTRTNYSASCRLSLREPYDIREVIARVVDGSEFRRVQAALRPDAGLRLCPCHGHSGRHHRQQWRALFRKRAQGRAFRRTVLAAQDPAGLPAEHHRLHGRQEIRGRRHRQGRREAGDRRRHHRGAQGDDAGRRLLRRGQLRHVGPRLFAALPVVLAQFAHLRDGRRAGGGRARHRASRRDRTVGESLERRGRGRLQGARRSPCSRNSRIRSTLPPACGTTA